MPEPLPADVLVAGRLTDDAVRELVDELSAVGVDAALREVPPRRSLTDVAWLLLAALPLKPFVDQLAKDAASDSFRRLTAIISKVATRLGRPPSTDPPSVLLLQDSSSGVQVVVESDLPPEALRSLAQVDLGAIRHGPLHYDRHRGRWRSELDEALAPRP